MLEPIVQDYLDASIKLDCEAFCRQVGAPVLVVRRAPQEQTFQLAATQMFEGLKKGVKRPTLGHKLPVLELRGGQGSSGEIGVGRAEENGIMIPDETVSARHARFFRVRTSGVMLLEDLESTNGTTINGKPVLPGRAFELHDGDELTFGDTRFVFFYPRGFYDALQEMLEPAES